jgi:hypothetical protein
MFVTRARATLSHRAWSLSLSLSRSVSVSLRVSMRSPSLLSSLSTYRLVSLVQGRVLSCSAQLRATSPEPRSSICDITLDHPIPSLSSALLLRHSALIPTRWRLPKRLSTTRTRHRTRRTSDLSSTLLPLLAPLDARVRRAGRPHCCATPHHQHHSSTPPHTSGNHGVAWPRVAHGRRGCRLPLQGLRRGAPDHT